MGIGASIEGLSPGDQLNLARHLHEEYVRVAVPHHAGGKRALTLLDDRGPSLVSSLDGAVGELLSLSLERRKARPEDNAATLNEEVLDAARESDLERMIALLSEQGLADATNDYTGSALMVAARNGDLPVVRTLIERGADLDMGDVSGHTALDHAIEHGQWDACTMLLLAGARAEETFHHAIWRGDVRTIRFLLGIDNGLARCQNKYGRTALAAACIAEEIDVCLLVLAAGVDVNKRAMRLRTALMDASCDGERGRREWRRVRSKEWCGDGALGG
jgi:ankyrin repeat protein